METPKLMKSLIAQDKLDKAIQEALNYIGEKEELHLDITLISQQFMDWKQRDILNIGNKDTAKRQIAKSLYEIADKISEQEDTDIDLPSIKVDLKAKDKLDKASKEFIQYYKENINETKKEPVLYWKVLSGILFALFSALLIYLVLNNGKQNPDEAVIYNYYDFINKGTTNNEYYKKAFHLFSTKRKNRYVKFFKDMNLPDDYGKLYPKKEMDHQVVSIGEGEDIGNQQKCYYVTLLLRNEKIPVNPIYYMVTHRNTKVNTLKFARYPDKEEMFNVLVDALDKNYEFTSSNKDYFGLSKANLIDSIKTHVEKLNLRELSYPRFIESIGNTFSLKPIKDVHEYKDLVEVYKIYLVYENGIPKIDKLPIITSQMLK